MKLLLSVFLLGSVVWASENTVVSELVHTLQRGDACLDHLRDLSTKYNLELNDSRRMTPKNAYAQIEKNCNVNDIQILQEYMSCLANSVCDWSAALEPVLATADKQDPFELLNLMPNLPDCPTPTKRPSQQCGTVFMSAGNP